MKRMEKMDQILSSSIKQHPEVSLVLEIAKRAREIEERELPREVFDESNTIGIPAHSQGVVVCSV